MPPQEVAGAAFDFNKDGKLDPNEFVQMIFHQKPDAKDMTKEELVELFQSVDTDHSADVSEKEYDAWVDKQKEEQNKDHVVRVQHVRVEGKAARLAALEQVEPDLEAYDLCVEDVTVRVNRRHYEKLKRMF